MGSVRIAEDLTVAFVLKETLFPFSQSLSLTQLVSLYRGKLESLEANLSHRFDEKEREDMAQHNVAEEICGQLGSYIKYVRENTGFELDIRTQEIISALLLRQVVKYHTAMESSQEVDIQQY